MGFQRAVLRREDQLLLTFFGVGSRQLKLIRASLQGQRAESTGRRFRHGVAQRAGQREKLAISNRLPRLQIRACYTLVGFGREQSAGFFLEDPGVEGGYVLLIPFRTRVLCREH